MPYSWIGYLFIANCAIAVVEYIYRTAQFHSFWVALPYIAIPILIGQYGLFHGFVLAPSLFVASGVFTCINILFRIGVTYYINENLSLLNWFGVLLLFSGVILLKVKP